MKRRNRDFGKKKVFNRDGLGVKTYRIGLHSNLIRFLRRMTQTEQINRIEDIIEIYIDEYLKNIAAAQRSKTGLSKEVFLDINVLDNKVGLLEATAARLGMTPEQFIEYLTIGIARRYRSTEKIPTKIILNKDR